MSRYLDTVEIQVKKLLQDDENRLNEDITSIIEFAVNILSIATPRKIVYDVTGDGSLFEWAVPATYSPDFSILESVEYPAGQSGERLQEFLDASDFDVILTATDTYKFRLLNDTPATTETVRFVFTAPHSLTTTSTTIPNKLQEDSVIILSAGLACQALASFYATNSDSTIVSDVVDHKSQSDKYAYLADRYIKMSGLESALHTARGEEVVYSTKDLDTQYSWGRAYLFHGKRAR